MCQTYLWKFLKNSFIENGTIQAIINQFPFTKEHIKQN